MTQHSSDGVNIILDPTGTAAAMGKSWCAICNLWGAHDTPHHDSQGGFIPGDMVLLTKPSPEYQHLQDKRGRVEGARGTDITVAFPTKGGTVTISVPASTLTPDV